MLELILIRLSQILIINMMENSGGQKSEVDHKGPNFRYLSEEIQVQDSHKESLGEELQIFSRTGTFEISVDFDEVISRASSDNRSSMTLTRVFCIGKEEETEASTPLSDIPKQDIFSKAGKEGKHAKIDQCREEEQEIDQRIAVLIILTASRQIKNVFLVDGQGVRNKIKAKKFMLDNQHVSISLKRLSLEQIQTFSIEYDILRPYLMIFSEHSKHQISLKSANINKKVGIIWQPDLSKQSSVLLNFCLLQAHQLLASYQPSRQRANPEVLVQFYKIFIELFDESCQSMDKVFSSLQVDDIRCRKSEHFLYLIYKVYREHGQHIIQKYDLLNKLHFNSFSVPDILARKTFLQFPNHHCFKDFLLFNIALYALKVMPQSHLTLSSILKSCIPEFKHAPLRVEQLFPLFESHPVMNQLIQDDQTNEVFLTNTEIAFDRYLSVVLTVAESALQKTNKIQKSQKFTAVLLSLIRKINKKAEISTSPVNPVVLELAETRMDNLFKKGEKYISLSLIGDIYFQAKRAKDLWGGLLLRIVSPLVMSNGKNLLKQHFKSIIYPLIVFPEQNNENILLMNYFGEQAMPSWHFRHLLSLMLKEPEGQFNIETVKLVLFKYVTLNPSFPDLDLEDVSQCLSNSCSDHRLEGSKKDFILKLCTTVLGREQHTQLMQFRDWWSKEKGRFLN